MLWLLTLNSLPYDAFHSSGIPLLTLPKTFQNAISIARPLRAPYLWIDSLCIIQDSKEDCAHESSLMGEVYRNLFCTIAATASKDPSEGCFRTRNMLCGTKQKWLKVLEFVVSRSQKSGSSRTNSDYLVWAGLRVNSVAPVAAWQWPAGQESTTQHHSFAPCPVNSKLVFGMHRSHEMMFEDEV